MFVNNPIPRNPMARMREGSRLASPRESNSIFNAWKHNDAAINRASQLTGNVSQIQRQVSSLRTKQLSPEDFYPFKIYQLPPALRDPYDPATDAFKFRVRSGWVEMRPDWKSEGDPVLGASYLVPLSGTGADGIFYYRDEIYSMDGLDSPRFAPTDIVVAPPGTIGDIFWFYIQLNQDTSGSPGPNNLSAVLTVDDTSILSPQNTTSAVGWPNEDMLIIGFVEFSYGVLNRIVNFMSDNAVNRFQRHQTRWRSDWDANALYYKGDVATDVAFVDTGRTWNFIANGFNPGGPPNSDAGWDRHSLYDFT